MMTLIFTKNLKYIAFTLIVCGYLCSSLLNDTSFKNYLSLFDQKDLPYLIDSTFIRNTTFQKSTSINPADISMFFEEEKDLGSGIKLFDVYQYFPHYKFSLPKNITAIILEKVGGAGGVEKMFYLVTYNRNGSTIDKILIAKEIGDCSWLELKTSEIAINLKIQTSKKLFKGDCEVDEYKLMKFEKEKFRITCTGQISADF